MELQRQMRIKAGIEEPDNYEVIEMAEEPVEDDASIGSTEQHITIRTTELDQSHEEYVISADVSSGIRILDASQIDERTLTKLISGDYETIDDDTGNVQTDPLVLNIEIDKDRNSSGQVRYLPERYDI